jgi:hypothetical protein
VTGDPAKLAAERTALRDELTQTKAFNMVGLLGPSYFDADNAAVLPTYIIEIHNSALQLLGTVQP